MGIILRRSVKTSNKVSLIDKHSGRIECIVSFFEKPVGSVITYTIDNKRSNFFLQDIECLYVPLSLGRSDLLFLHHIFEIIYYFAPVGSCVQGVFDLLAFLYTIEHMLISMKFKKFFLFKLLRFLGIAPEMEDMHVLNINQLHRIAIDQFNDMVIDEEDEKKLDKWLWCCIWQHPYVNEFKTVHFLEKNRTT
jgi:hypothetical protein